MDPEIKQKWLAALRSGEFAQANGALRKGETFCCLGVLCSVIDPEKWEFDEFYDGKDLSLTSENLNRVGLTRYAESALANMNDNGQSFPEIADYIEKNL